MKNFKLRAFDKTNKEMANDVAIVGRRIIFEHNSEGYDLDELELTYLDILDGKNEYVIMQYTGLKDMNGKEIYEGDILKEHDLSGRVTWVQEHCAFLVFTPEPSGYHYLESDGQLTNSEVIGNIYENPELLEGK